MNNIFNSKLYKALDKITNLFFINMMWLLASLPLITLFPATAAMVGIYKDWSEGKESDIFKSFFIHFKTNFKHSFIYGLLWFLVLIIFYIDIGILSEFESYNFILTALLFLLLILVAFHTVYFIPISVYYNLTLFEKIKNAFLFSIMFFPTTILCLIICGVTLLSVIFFPALMFIIFSPVSYLLFRLCLRTFIKVSNMKRKN